METLKNLLLLSYAKRVLQTGSREQQRMEAYAATIAPRSLVVVVLTRHCDALPQLYKKDNLTVIGTQACTRIGMLIAAYSLMAGVVKEAPKMWLVSTQDPFETGFVGQRIARRFGVQHHVQLHGDQFGNPAWRNERPLNALKLWYGRRVLARACGIRVVSLRAKRALLSIGVPAAKITVLPIVADLEAFLAVGAARTYPHGTGKPVTILYVGRFSPEKNVPRIIDAFAVIARELPNVRLHLIGAGAEEALIRKKVAAHGLTPRVTLAPWTNDVPAAMRAADMLVLASLHEGYAMVLVEAMAAGLPIVTTDVGCVGELVVNGQHAIVAGTPRVSDLAPALLALARDPDMRMRYGKAAHTAAQCFHQSSAAYVESWKASFCL